MIRSGNIPSTILYIGAGTGSELDEWLATGATRVILVEPNPERARELATRAAADDRVEVLQKAVAAESGQRRLKRFNLPALSSLREPTGLLELFPGLTTEREVEVDAITPVELIETAELFPDNNHWLIIDSSGEEAAIVNVLHTADQLAHFNRIILHCGTEPLYSDNPPAATLLDQLQEAGYDIEQQDDSDPDRPRWSLHRNVVRLENQALRQRIAELEQQAQELADAHDERAQKAKELEQVVEARQQDKENLEKKFAELEQQAQDLAEARDERGQKAKELERVVEARQQDKENLEKKFAELEQQAQELAKARDQATAAAEKAEETLVKRENEVKTLKSKLSGRSEEVMKLRESVERGEDSLVRERELRTRLDTEFARAEAQLSLLVQLMTGNFDGEGGGAGNRLSSSGGLDFDDENAPAEPDSSENDQK